MGDDEIVAFGQGDERLVEALGDFGIGFARRQDVQARGGVVMQRRLEAHRASERVAKADEAIAIKARSVPQPVLLPRPQIDQHNAGGGGQRAAEIERDLAACAIAVAGEKRKTRLACLPLLDVREEVGRAGKVEARRRRRLADILFFESGRRGLRLLRMRGLLDAAEDRRLALLRRRRWLRLLRMRGLLDAAEDRRLALLRRRRWLRLLRMRGLLDAVNRRLAPLRRRSWLRLLRMRGLLDAVNRRLAPLRRRRWPRMTGSASLSSSKARETTIPPPNRKPAKAPSSKVGIFFGNVG